MVSKSELKSIAEAYRKVPKDEVLNHFQFESSLMFNPKNIKLTDNGWAYYQEGASIYKGVTNINNPEQDPNKFIESLSSYYEIERVYSEENQLGELLNGLPKKKMGMLMFLYDNNGLLLSKVGKDYHRFRTSSKYLEDPDFRVEEFDNNNPLTYEALSAIMSLNDSWKAKKKEDNDPASYDVNRCIKNLFEIGSLTEYYVTLIWYKEELLHFHSSERLHNNFAILLDSKVNFGVDKELNTQFRYCNFLQHWLHIKKWHIEGEKVYYHSGMTSMSSYKVQLRPAIISKYYLTLVADMPFISRPSKSNSLF
jgi:hypothetical protein